MDIDLLSRMVKDLIMGNDAVTLPGVGTFVADLMPSTFSDKGYTINPPYRRLYFTPKIGSDTLLVDLYAGSNGISAEESAMILGDFLSQMKEVLKVRKTIVFPGLGRLRATRENNFFFVADEDLDIYPEGLALEPVSLKNHIETKAEVRQAVESLAGLMSGPAPVQKEDQPSEVSPGESEVTEAIAAAEPVDEPVAEEPVTEEPVAEEPVAEEPAVEEPAAEEPAAEAPAKEPEPVPAKGPETAPSKEPVPVKEKKPRRKSRFWKVFWRIVLILFLTALVVAVAWIIIGRVAPELIDPLLYTPEELEIINY